MKRRFRGRRAKLACASASGAGRCSVTLAAGAPSGSRARLHFELMGRQDADAATVLLCSGLGGLGSFWQPQLTVLSEHFRVLIYDQRGTGKSPAQLPADYALPEMAADVAEIADELGITRMHFIGHALGGLIGMALALQRPQLIQRMVIINGWANIDSHTLRCFAVRKALLRNSGVAAYLQAQPIFLFPASWLSANAQRMEAEEAHALAHFPPPQNVLARIDALSAYDPGAQLAALQVPTLVYATRDDVLVPYTRSLQLAERLPRAVLELRASGGHGCTVTEPEQFNQIALRFLQAEQT